MSFCRKITPHSLLGFTAATTTTAPPPTDENIHHYIPSLTGGLLGLITATADDVIQRQPLVLESSTVNKHSSSSLPPFLPPPATKVVSAGGGDIGGFGFLDDVGGGVDGFVSCTESLGFESSDEIMRVDDQVEQDDEEDEVRMMRQSENKRSKWRRMGEKRSVDREKKKFPPPISSLNQNGQPNFYLRPVRKDGRLELTEVRIHRPEILRAYREDGRLRLHLISHDEQEECIEEEQEEEIEEEEVDIDVKEEKENVDLDSSVNGGDQWKMGVAGGEGFRRCQDVSVSCHHHHHVWSQQHCVV